MTGSPRPLLLDTSVVIAAFRLDPAILQRLAIVQSVVSATVLGELYHGAYTASQTTRELAYIAGLIANSTVLDCDRETARHYGSLRRTLRLQGTPIPENDIWIAATALQHGLPLATRDAHFTAVPGLIVEQW